MLKNRHKLTFYWPDLYYVDNTTNYLTLAVNPLLHGLTSLLGLHKKAQFNILALLHCVEWLFGWCVHNPCHYGVGLGRHSFHIVRILYF